MITTEAIKNPTRVRILFTGSRTWDNIERIWDECDTLLVDHGPYTAVHGGCPDGADQHVSDWIAHQVAKGIPIVEEVHPADWTRCVPSCRHRTRQRHGRPYCPAAGPRRNAVMVALGATEYRAFIRDNSPGATGCADLADRAGIPGKRITYPAGAR